MAGTITQPQWETSEEVLVAEQEAVSNSIVVWNDDVNTFDHVIQCLVEICDHTEEQAEQCALFIHYKGKYAVKNGSFDELRPRCEALQDRGLSATIE